MNDLLLARVTTALETLRLKTALGVLHHHLDQAKEREPSYLEFLDHLLADELAARKERSILVRTKLAHFPVTKTLESFDFDAQPSLERRTVNELQTMAFVERAENVFLLGPPEPVT